MISRKVTVTIAGVALVAALGGGALALANGDDLVSPARVGTSSSVGDDGTPDQGPGDAPGTVGANDDGTADQGPGDAPGTPGAGEDSHHGGDDGHSGHGGDDNNSGPGGGGEDNSGPGGNSGQG